MVARVRDRKGGGVLVPIGERVRERECGATNEIAQRRIIALAPKPAPEAGEGKRARGAVVVTS